MIAWILGIVNSPSLFMWGTLLLGGLGLYGVLMAHRLMTPPTEHSRFLTTLALSSGDIRNAKAAPVILRGLFVTVVVGAPIVWRAGDQLLAAAIAVGIGVVSVTIALLSR